MKNACFVLISLVAVTACTSPKPQTAAAVALDDLIEQPSPAFREAVRLHAARVAALPAPESAGLWVVQDTKGHLVSSGVLEEFPTEISSRDYGNVVPGAAGIHAEQFGFARTERVDGNGPFRVAYVTVAAKP